jgi:hypothetical protein
MLQLNPHALERTAQRTGSTDLDCAKLAVNLYESIQVEEVGKAYIIYVNQSLRLSYCLSQCITL